MQETTKLLLITGVLGALTTFSTFGWESLELMQNGKVGVALVNIGLNVIVSLVAAFSIALSLLRVNHWPGWIYFFITPLIYIGIFIKEKYTNQHYKDDQGDLKILSHIFPPKLLLCCFHV